MTPDEEEAIDPCWVCDSEDIYYTDILGMTWCLECWEVFS